VAEFYSFAIAPDTGVYGSCSAVLDGKMYIFGGFATNTRIHTLGDGNMYLFNQISEIDQCGIRRIGDLPFWFFLGGCNTFETNAGEQFVLLCFGVSAKDYWGFNATRPSTTCYK